MPAAAWQRTIAIAWTAVALATATAGGHAQVARPRPSQPAQPACLGDRQPLTVASRMPYALVSVGGRQGYMVMDFGASLSSISPAGFQGPVKPAPAPGNTDQFDDFVFFGPWGRVRLAPQPQPQVQAVDAGGVPLAQAGVLGTDFLAQHAYTLDYPAGHVFRAGRDSFCGDDALAAAGYRAVSTQGYYGSNPASLSCPRAGVAPGGCANIPTVPVRIGPVMAWAQLDTGYDDSRQPYSVNINAALLDELRAAGVRLRPRPDLALQLSTCVAGVSEPVEAYALAASAPFGFVTTDGRLLPRGRSLTLLVKRTPPAAAVCGGIGTWAQPAAQLGASFVSDGALVVDPFSARIWLR